jgi:two-component system, LytTR family, sensor kinase
MSPSSQKYTSVSQSRLDMNLFVPLFLILTLIAIINSLQAVYLFTAGVHSIRTFLRISTTKFLYWWYFIFVAYVVQWLSRRIILERKSVFKWFGVHTMVLAISFFTHQTLSLFTDRLLLGEGKTMAWVFLLFNNPSIWIELFIYTLFLLTFYLREFRRISRENELKCSQLEVELIKSKLQELRSKIHPQFLFNTLRTISDLVKKHRNKDANRILGVLSDFLRTTVYDTEREEITLGEELKFLNQYLEIENMRCNNMIDMKEEIDRAVFDAIVPNFILQPIVEQVASCVSATGKSSRTIVLKAKKEGHTLDLSIEGPYGQIYSGAEERRKDWTIFNITRDRLKQLYGNKQIFTVSADAVMGICVKIQIPFDEKRIETEAAFILEKSF